MGIAITEDQRELARAVRGWAARAVPSEEVRKLLDAPADGSGRPAYWDGLAAQGLLGPHLPEAYGGGGGGLLDLAVVLEETGRAVLPGPYLPTVLASAVLARAGQGELAAALAGGARVGAVALGAGSLTATPAAPGDAVRGWVLDGCAPPVLGAADADFVVLAATTAGGGTAWFAVDARDLEIRAHDSADPTRPTAEVRALRTAVPADRALAVDPGLVRDLAAVLFAAEACGTAAWALETAVAHARTREQFGRPIGQFQAVKHLCADMLVRVEQARALTWDAARAAGEEPAARQEPAVREEAPTGDERATRDEPPTHAKPMTHAKPTTDAEPATYAQQNPRALTAALAVASALDAAHSCAKDCIQILGGIGFTWEHDAHLHLRRATAARALLGTGGAHRLRAARLAAAGARRELRLELPAEGEVRRDYERYRTQARAAIEAARGLDPAAARRALAPTGHAAPHLPPPYGLGAGPVQQLAVQRELADAGVVLSDLGVATWVVPSLIAYGTPEQRERYLLPTLRGELRWCQLFSEPEAGSDLAALRTKAERTEEGWRVSGQKVWTSGARRAHHGILLARTDPRAPKHKGLTYFLVDMERTAGIDIRPLREITGEALFNEVYLDDVLLPHDAVVGEVDGGWAVARNTLGNERVHMADQLTFDTGLEALIARTADPDNAADGAGADDWVRERVGALMAEAHALACLGLRTTLRQVSGVEPGAGASVRKLIQTAHQQKVAELALELLGPAGAVREGVGERTLHGFLMSRCLTIAGGTTQVQLNVVAERMLGLPRDPAPA
ncbi:acyl-CoA dehydrogenase domain protein [Streptomyces bingchenggensis BCW-1]|uniref:Acyl-CoA dehydrogenase domain protein n=1 Tax=Streptomyces bingchenggensis (strain BCW-1) TaxID=749414 RepID=D7CB48_STRBB|nr:MULTISPECIES: acyl-CoA dehydrogenase [Streptomyces]ADI10731.1 acyl-CoA dehydrogenase domain protein [Streptomyces bingchenggensis BCW-1]